MCTKHLGLLIGLSTVLAVQAQLPSTSPGRAGFDPERLEVMHETVGRFVEEGKHAGIITLLARNGKIADVQTFGYRDLEKRLPMERETICRVYSMSKLITSVGVLILWEEGRFNLDDAASKYLSELAEMKVMTGGSADHPELRPVRTPITIKHLLTHTSGLIYDFDPGDGLPELYRRADLWNSEGLDEFMKKVGQLPLKHDPGAAWSYGINTDVLGALIERVSGQRFGEFLQERIFGPLEMKDTGFDVAPEDMARVAVTYQHGANQELTGGHQILETWPEPGRGIESGGAGLFSTVDDYARFAQMLLNGGTLEDARILGRKTVELMTSNHLLHLEGAHHGHNASQGFGLGVEVQLDPGHGPLPAPEGAFGWYGAATTYVRIDPREKIVAIAFAQHLPFNQHNLFAKWATGYYQALK